MSRHREALNETIKMFKIVQADLSRKTEELEKAGKGKKVATDSLNRYLKGKKDLYSEAVETLENALDDVPRAFYFSLLVARLAATSSTMSANSDKQRKNVSK